MRAISATEDQHSATVTMEDDTTDTGDLILGADGIGSSIREFVAPGSEPRHAG